MTTEAAVVDLVGPIQQGKFAGLQFNDVGNARRLLLLHGNDLMLVPGVGWHWWDGTRWRRDADGEVMRRMKATTAEMREQAARMPERTGEALSKWAYASENRTRLQAGIELAETEAEVITPADDLDADAFALNCVNGTVNLNTGELRPHRREDRITKLAPVAYDPDAECPLWLAFLDTVFPNNKTLIAYVQRAVGYSLTGSTREQCLFLPNGEGENGKSTLLETVGALVGEYGCSADPATFMTSSRRGVRSDLARLRGARFVRSVEVESDAHFGEVLVKQLTGGDMIVASYLYENEFQFRPAFKLWIAANSLPEIRGTDHAIWRRIRRIPFDVRIERPDKTFGAKLLGELPGILQWAIAGCIQWQRDGLGIPDAVDTATQDYRREQDTVGGFLAARCEMKPDAEASSSALYASYCGYCAGGGGKPLGRTAFGRALGNTDGLKNRHDRDGSVWEGIALI